MARELTSLEILGKEVPLQQVRFMAAPSATVPGILDAGCFVPNSAVTKMDPQSLPGALVADIMLSMGIGELRGMTRVSSMGWHRVWGCAAVAASATTASASPGSSRAACATAPNAYEAGQSGQRLCVHDLH